MVEYCSMCGEKLLPEEEGEGLCRSCLSILSNKDIDVF